MVFPDLNMLPVLWATAPALVMCLMIGLKQRKAWMARLSLIGLTFALILLIGAVYLDYQSFEDCLLPKPEYDIFLDDCISLH
ncbi:hypothetical protein [Photobacterium sp. TY1-4]|uniref:hypothetical protein n=1 Tax=Photobacterium sp. TY1-4 TaxID=2899122 RepID=UPI0021C01A37|nr:hypothetical protein [Photobacterium sp. TY1-4]UXI04274.1 hypothetical protein NH461_19485 [Photobacterium sp. TY1-4]